MSSTPAEIRNHSFRRAMRGFDTAEVESFLDRIASEWEGMIARTASLEQRLQEAEVQVREFRGMEKGFQQTIVQAQEAGGKAVDSARREGQLIIGEAELKAAQIVDKARNDLTQLKEQVTILRAKKDSITSRLKHLLSSELELIASLETGEERARPAADEERPDLTSEKTEIEEIIRSLDR